jgi:hypothetical protein
MNKFVTVCILLSGVAFLLNCTCIGEMTVKEAIKKSDIVFVGKITSADTIFLNDTFWGERQPHEVKYRVTPSLLYKGKITSSTIEIVSGIGFGDCGYDFAVGSEYVIYAYYKNGDGASQAHFLYTQICTRTCPRSDAEIKAIEKYKKNILKSR